MLLQLAVRGLLSLLVIAAGCWLLARYAPAEPTTEGVALVVAVCVGMIAAHLLIWLTPTRRRF